MIRARPGPTLACLALLIASPIAAAPPAPAVMIDHPAPRSRAQPPATIAQPGAPPATPDAQLDRLMAETSHAQFALDPLAGLYWGDRVPHDLLVQLFTPQLAARQRTVNDHALVALAGIERAALNPAHRLSYDVLRQILIDQRALLDPAVQALVGVQPFTHFMGFPVEFPEMVATARGGSLASQADVEARLELMRTLPALLANAENRFREGIASGVVEPRLTVTMMIAEIDAILAKPAASSQFMVPPTYLPRTTPPATRARIGHAFLVTTTDTVYPAYRRLQRFLAETYLPAARDSVGLSAMPGGAGLYRLLVRTETTLPLDPEAVHQTGLREVARIQQEMRLVEHDLGSDVPLPRFFESIRSDPRFHPRSAEDLGDGYRQIAARVARLAPRWFRTLPRTPLLIQPFHGWRARFEAGATYSVGLPDGSRPGIFRYNTYDWPHRFTSESTTLYLHEGAPGHHFQISLAQENEALPDIQRFGGNAAYVEGWALYAESLGYEMGLYRDPLQHWGNLDDEMLRAMRLVVDTGLHTRGWTRDQAIAYMLENSGIGLVDAGTEVDRYIANPGQALAYKIGAMTIQRLRAEAEATLGPRFDIRAFHDAVLGAGVLPMTVLEAHVREWIASQSASDSAISARVLARP